MVPDRDDNTKMLQRSYKPAKCKTALKMVVSRTKYLKKRKEVVVKQLRRDLAQLLDSGQVHTARIQVEHVDREEKMMAACELIEIFCELIAIHLPMIESQKNCPVDMKEAVSSVIFAAPRCLDIPELADVGKHFTAKYGKEFASAAIELCPDCGVNRNLVEKLSVKAPDGPTILKILTAIAEEHNVKWDPKSFADKYPNPQEELLNESKSLDIASKVHVESTIAQVPYYDNASSNAHIHPQYEEQGVPMDHHCSNLRSSFSPQRVVYAHVDSSAAPSSNMKDSEIGNKWVIYGNLYPEDQNHNFLNQKNWNLEFKDATSAALAAAESAERATMAARAAVELYSHEELMIQYSIQSHNSSANALRGEMPSFDSKAFARGQVSNNLELRSSRSQNEAVDAREQHDFMVNAERLYGDCYKSRNRSSNSTNIVSSSVSSKGDNPLSRHQDQMSNESVQSYGALIHRVQTSMTEEEDEEDVDLSPLDTPVAQRSHQSEIGSLPSGSQRASGGACSNRGSFGINRSYRNLHGSEDVAISNEFNMGRFSQNFEVEPSDETQDVLRNEKASNLVNGPSPGSFDEASGPTPSGSEDDPEDFDRDRSDVLSSTTEIQKRMSRRGAFPYHLDPHHHGMGSVESKKTISGDSLSSYEIEQSEDFKEEVPSQVWGNMISYGDGLSGSTKGNTLKTDMTSRLKPSTSPHEEETQKPSELYSRRSYNVGKSAVESAYTSKESETLKRRMDIRPSLRSSHSTEKGTGSDRDALDDTHSSSGLPLSREAIEQLKSQPTKFSSRGTHTDQRTKDGTNSSLGSFGTEANGSTQTEGAVMDNRRISDQLHPAKEKGMEKPNSEHSKSSEGPSDYPQTSCSSSTSQPAKLDPGDTLKVRPRHVHPKLPEYDVIITQMELLRSRQS
ncbi:hypothetical protein SAY87_002099 [Trapa incisa]|uniref:IST1-like protein n=1 Tax=Trapa incisa TaxID=236973 RepID=A0AAN7PYN1_9MYRT|nr:hypothetical protein SAY87_002099 [Trapa incisa]